MELFFQTSLTFPVVLFSFMLCVAMLYWLTVALGAVDVDVLDAGGDGGMDDPSNAEGLGVLLMKLGLHDVPVTLVLPGLVPQLWAAAVAPKRLQANVGLSAVARRSATAATTHICSS